MTVIAGNIMKLDETEFEPSFFETSNTRVDRTVGYLLVGLVVLLALSAFIFGMMRFHETPGRVVDGSRPQTVNREPRPEIGNTADAVEVPLSQTSN